MGRRGQQKTGGGEWVPGEGEGNGGGREKNRKQHSPLTTNPRWKWRKHVEDGNMAYKKPMEIWFSIKAPWDIPRSPRWSPNRITLVWRRMSAIEVGVIMEESPAVSCRGAAISSACSFLLSTWMMRPACRGAQVRKGQRMCSESLVFAIENEQHTFPLAF